MFYHSYENINDIEPEFLISLNNLYKDKCPNFDFIKEKEIKEDKTTYYLFFGSNDNSPKAFLKAKTIETKIKLLPFLNKKEVQWSGPSTINSSFFIDPKYQNDFKESFNQIKLKLNKDFNISQQTVISNLKIETKQIKSDKLVKSLFKSSNSYEAYIASLSIAKQKEIKNLFLEHKDLVINQYDSLQDSFNYKSKNKETYGELKKRSPYKLLKQTRHKVITIEDNEQILAFSVLIINDSGHCFFHINNLLNLIDNQLLLHLSILRFYDQEDVLYLHPLEKTLFDKTYQELSFTSEIEREFLL